MVASQQRAVAGPAAQDRRAGRGRGLWRPVDGARAGAQRRRGHGAGARRVRRRRLDAQRRRASAAAPTSARASRARAEERSRGMEEGHDAHAGRRRRFAGPGADRDRARGHRVPLAHERPLQSAPGRRKPLRRAGGQGRAPTTSTPMPAPRWCRASGSARDRLRLLLRRHGGRRAPASSIPRSTTGACSKAAHRAGAILCAQCEAEKHRAKTGTGWRGADHQGADRGARGRDRDQRLYRRPHAAG